MRIAILSDIHANREALSACLAQAEGVSADRYVILGDIVGYGADPQYCTEKIMDLAERGAIVIRGNHDHAIADADNDMNSHARTAIDWTRRHLDAAAKAFLAALPLEYLEEDRLYVHADATAPARWNYVTDGDEARRHIMATPARISFCGHIHRPQLYGLSDAGKLTSFTPTTNAGVPLPAQRRWLGVMGAVGQPRDGNPMAAWGLLDTRTRELRFMRTVYDIETAANKIRAAGLPESLATRLTKGM